MDKKAEQGIIGAILIDNDSLSNVYSVLKPEMFQNAFYRRCFTQILAMYDRGIKIDMVTLTQEVKSDDVDNDFTIELLTDCITEVPYSDMIKEYAGIVVKEYKSIKVAEIVGKIKYQPKNIDSSIAALMTELDDLQKNKDSHSHSLSDIVDSYSGNYFNDDKSAMDMAIKTGFPMLDECLGGLTGGDVYVIGARPAVGKSAFATQIIKQVAMDGKKVGYFNLEMSDSQVYERLISSISEIQLTRVRRAIGFLGDEKENFSKGNEALKKLDIIISTGSKSDGDIKNECRHQNFDLIVIDYLQLVTSSRKCESRRVEVGAVSRSLKELSMELDVPIIVLSQLNRGSEYTSTKEPSMADLRETGDIEQDASAIVMLWKLSDDPLNAKYKGLKVEKNRQGELTSFPMYFDGDLMTFSEIENLSIHDLQKELKEDSGFNPRHTDSPFG